MPYALESSRMPCIAFRRLSGMSGLSLSSAQVWRSFAEMSKLIKDNGSTARRQEPCKSATTDSIRLCSRPGSFLFSMGSVPAYTGPHLVHPRFTTHK